MPHCPHTGDEYQQQQTILWESPEHGNAICYGVLACTKSQCHRNAHIVCVSQWNKVLFQPHNVFPEFAANAQ